MIAQNKERIKALELVSIIIPVYNVEQYIEKCMDSVVAQDYENLEIIVINDGSKDDSIEIVRKYESNKVKIVEKKNGGLSAARNSGVKYCKGEYIFFLDSDDWIEPDTISSLVKEMNQDIDIVQGSIRRVSTKSVSIDNVGNRIIDKNLLEEYFKKENLNTVVWNKLYRRNIVVTTPFVEGYVNEDVIFTFQIAKNNYKVKNIDKVIYNYRIRDESIMHNKNLTQRMRVIKSLDYVINECYKHNCEYVSLASYDKYITLLYLYCYAKNGELSYQEKDLTKLDVEIKSAKANFKLKNVIGKVNKKQFFALYLPSLFSKNLVAILFRIKD